MRVRVHIVRAAIKSMRERDDIYLRHERVDVDSGWGRIVLYRGTDSIGSLYTLHASARDDLQWQRNVVLLLVIN